MFGEEQKEEELNLEALEAFEDSLQNRVQKVIVEITGDIKKCLKEIPELKQQHKSQIEKLQKKIEEIKNFSNESR